MPLDVLCQGGCGSVYFETNDKDGSNPHVTGIKSQFVRKYDPDAMANAAMIRMKDEFMGIYDNIPHDSDLFSAAIGPCPGCGHPFSNDDFKLITTGATMAGSVLPLFANGADRIIVAAIGLTKKA